MKLFFVTIGLIVLTLTTLSNATPPTLSLRDAIQYALEHSPIYDTAKKNQAISNLEYQSSVARMLPSIDLSATHGLQDTLPHLSNSSAPWVSSLNLGLTENLYDNGASLTQMKIAQLRSDLSLVTTRKERDTLVLGVAKEFYQYSLAHALLEVRKQQQSVLNQRFQTLKSEYEQGFKTQSDFLRLKAQVQRAEIDRVGAENALRVSAAELYRILGVGIEEPAPPEFNPIFIQGLRDLDRLIPETRPPLQNTYENRLSKLQRQINDRSVNLVRRNYLPRIAVTSGISYSKSNYLGTDPSVLSQLSWNALLTLQFNLWDWGIRKRDVQIAELNQDIRDNEIQQSLLGIQTQMTALSSDLGRIRRTYRLSRDLLALEEESNRNLEVQYREGKVSYLDLITGINSLLDARVQLATSAVDALKGIAQNKYFEGTVYELAQ